MIISTIISKSKIEIPIPIRITPSHIIGILGTGTGKTLLAANMAEVLVQQKRVKHVITISPASLVANFRKDVRKCTGIGDNAKLPDYYQGYSFDEFLNGEVDIPPQTLLIIDEVHNLRNAASKKSNKVLDAAALTYVAAAIAAIGQLLYYLTILGRRR